MSLRPVSAVLAHSTTEPQQGSVTSATRAGVGELVKRYGSRAIRWSLVLILAVSAIIGLLFITRGTAVQRVRGVGADGASVSPAESEFPLAVATLTGTLIVE